MSMAEYSEIILGFVRAHKEWAGPIVLLLAFGESLAFISLILPFWIILVGIGTIIGASDTLNYWTVLSCAAIGAALGDWLSYWLGYHYHERIVIGRFSGPLRASIPIVAGVTQMPQIKFQIANWSSAFIWAFVLLSPGTYGMKWWLNHFS